MSSSFSASVGEQTQESADEVDTHADQQADGLSGTLPATDSADDCHFLEIPAELRIRIYDMVLEDSPPKLSRNTRMKLTTGYGLLRVNKQISAELTDRVLHGPMPIEATVNDFQFAHVVTFLNRLPDRALKKLTPAKDDTEEKRRLNITMNFYKREESPQQPLQRWLNRLATDKRGTQIDICYFAGPDFLRGLGWYGGTGLQRAIRLNTEGSVQWNEAQNILSALSEEVDDDDDEEEDEEEDSTEDTDDD